MSTNGITSSLLSQIAGSPSEANRFVTDLNQLAQDVKSGNLTAAQGDYVTLSQDALNGAGSSTATTSASGITAGLLSGIASSSGSATAFTAQVNQLGTDIQSGNLVSAQQDLLGLDSTALNAASSTVPNSNAATSAIGTIPVTNTAERGGLIHSIVQALEAGNTSVASNSFSQLASLSPSAAGAAALEQESKNFGSSAGSTATSSSTTQLLQSLNVNSSSNSSSLLSLLA